MALIEAAAVASAKSDEHWKAALVLWENWRLRVVGEFQVIVRQPEDGEAFAILSATMVPEAAGRDALGNPSWRAMDMSAAAANMVSGLAASLVPKGMEERIAEEFSAGRLAADSFAEFMRTAIGIAHANVRVSE